MAFARGRRQKNWPKTIAILFVVLLLTLISAMFVVRREYNRNLLPVSESQKSETFTIAKGATVNQVGKSLQDTGLIRASWAFEWYFRSNKLADRLKAGTYSLRRDMSVRDIANIITEGVMATDKVTILPGKRIDEIRTDMINSGFHVDAVDKALDPKNYADHPALVDKPADASLEGYIYPETFQKIASTQPYTIIKTSLDELHQLLTPKMRADITKQGLTVHQAIILASIVEKEAGTEAEKPKIAQVFIKRLNNNIKLQSDATAGYGAVLSGEFGSLNENELLNYQSDYNTYLHMGLPPGPISNFNASSLEAVAQPSKSDYLYFVSGKDCITRFSVTIEEHNELQKKYGVRDHTTVCK